MQSSKSHAHKAKSVKGNATRKIIFLLIVIIMLALGIGALKYFWLNKGAADSQLGQRVSTLESKIASLHQNIHASVGDHAINTESFVALQIKDAYQLTQAASMSLRHGNISVAKQLLAMANERLTAISDVKVEKAKELLQADQAKLNALQLPDMNDLQEKLAFLDKLINVLPVKGTVITTTEVQPVTQVAASSSSKWRQAWNNFLLDVQSLIKVRKKTTDTYGGLTNVAVDRAQFKLLIEQMRWAAFYNQEKVYERCVKLSQELLPTIFDMNSESAQKFAEILQELSKVHMQTETPDLQDSVNALQALLVG